ncbi:hypothetical protein [Polyangium aurulentum]|uniref:hypothetical protein n=1 Tax=Polyangium aurulentum TaxID=2567896 RepID=UPI0010AE2F46|nr:hypothetical protein [Polyangium aurulentum]UQA56396.1 hypothetical protein E8A73_034530 [Polyangium aurulentum]
MMRFTKTLAAAAMAAATALLAGSAWADGLLMKGTDLPEAARARLVKEVAEAKAQHPEAFAAVRGVRGHRPEVYRTFRNPVPMVERELRGLGPSALWPMLEAIALEKPPTDGLSSRDTEALAAGLLAAVGSLRDARSGPVLRVAFERSAAGSRVERAAAEAMGRLCGDAELSTLVARSAAGQERRLAAIGGLGECKRTESAKQLAQIAAGSEEAAAEAAIGALGRVGSSWAWQALGREAEAQGEAVRSIAARGLVDAFVAHRRAEARAEVQKAILLVEHPAALDAIDRARGRADQETVIALDALRARVAPKLSR